MGGYRLIGRLCADHAQKCKFSFITEVSKTTYVTKYCKHHSSQCVHCNHLKLSVVCSMNLFLERSVKQQAHHISHLKILVSKLQNWTLVLET